MAPPLLHTSVSCHSSADDVSNDFMPQKPAPAIFAMALRPHPLDMPAYVDNPYPKTAPRPLTGTKVYVMGRITEPEPMAAMQDALQHAGARVVLDWTTYDKHMGNPSTSRKMELLHVEGDSGLGGVAASNVVVAVFTDGAYPYTSTIAQIAAAIAMNRRVVRVVTPAVAAAIQAASLATTTPWLQGRAALPAFVDDPFWHVGGSKSVIVTSADEAIAAIRGMGLVAA